MENRTTFLTLKLLAIAIVCLLPSEYALGQIVTEYYKGGGDKYLIASNLDVQAYATSTTLGIYDNNQWYYFEEALYDFDGEDTPVYYTNGNLKQIAVDRGGQVYVTTLDNHLLYYKNGKLIGGVPVKFNSLYKSIDEYIYGVIELFIHVVPVEISDEVGEVDFIPGVLFDDDLNLEVLVFDPVVMSYNGEFPMVISRDKEKLGFFHDGNSEFKIYESPTSYLPCQKFKWIDHTRVGTTLRAICACENNEIYILNHPINSLTAKRADLVASEWEQVNTSSINGAIGEIRFFGRKNPSDGAPQHVFGYTDASENGLFLYNPIANTTCVFDLPGNQPILDIDIPKRNIIIATTGDQVYYIDVEDWLCEISTPTVDISPREVLVYPNPTDGIFVIENVDTKPISYIHIYNQMGAFVHTVEHIDDKITIAHDLGKGLFTIHIVFDDRTSIIKNIIRI